MSDSESPPPRPNTRRLPLMLLWGFSPALICAIAALMMHAKPMEGLGGMLMVTGLMGGPVILLVWSVRVLWWSSWSDTAKILLVLPLAAVGCVVNLFLAAGACAAIKPPLGFH